MCDYSTYQPVGYHLGSHIPATSVEPSSSSVDWTLSINTNPPQIPAPIFHPENAGAMNTLGSNVQGNIASTFLHFPPLTSIQDPFLPLPSSR